ncbi:hypothetical protein Tco_1007351 [Tanacetum coccineum]
MLRLQGLGANTLTGVPYTNDRPLFARASSTGTFPVLSPNEAGSGRRSGGGGDDEPGNDEDAGENEEDEDR